jgi:hypothetical protein
LYEALDLAVGLRTMGFDSQMFYVPRSAELSEAVRLVRWPVIRDRFFDGDPVSREPIQRVDEELEMSAPTAW